MARSMRASSELVCRGCDDDGCSVAHNLLLFMVKRVAPCFAQSLRRCIGAVA